MSHIILETVPGLPAEIQHGFQLIQERRQGFQFPFLPEAHLDRGRPGLCRRLGAGFLLWRGRGEFPLAQPVVVAAHVFLDPALAGEDQGAGHHVVQKSPVVAHQQQRALEVQEQFLQKLQGLDVEVVGGLVEDQDVGRARKQARQKQEYSDQQEQIRQLTDAARRIRGIAVFRKGGKADTGDKFAKAFFANRGLATIKRAKKIEARVERLLNEDHIEKPRASWQMKMEFKGVPESGRDVLILDHLTIGYGKTPILADLNAVIRYGDRVALSGENGCGKTTLLRTAVGILPPLSGRCRLGASVIPGFLTQEQENLLPEDNALLTLQRTGSLPESDARAYLHKYLFTNDEVFTPVKNLSWGQRVRLSLACLVAGGCNFLLLDEPLNHLDLPSRAQFERALADFSGTVLAVTHDRYFTARFATCLWHIADGKLSVTSAVPLDN